MDYEVPLRFFLSVCEKSRLQALLLPTADEAKAAVDLGLRQLLGRRLELPDSKKLKGNTIYKYTDPLGCSYILLRLPADGRLLLVGPFLRGEISRQELLALVEKLDVPPRLFRQIEDIFAGIPVVGSDSILYASVSALGEEIWGGPGSFRELDFNQELGGLPPPLSPASVQEDALGHIRALERRYAFENEILQAVSQGLTHKADLIFTGFSRLFMEQRVQDTMRNLKNYCIIMNTLLRKAAESGAVHPVYLDSLSSAFARRIELLGSPEAARKLMEEMFRSYCRLVKHHSMKHYSPPIQRVMIHIDSDIGGDLSLKNLARAQNINASYLSALFRRETGQTLTDYVNQKRIRYAARLLRNTSLQVQAIAQHCGIPDVNYFSKVFRKYIGMTPKEFRRQRAPISRNTAEPPDSQP